MDLLRDHPTKAGAGTAWGSCCRIVLLLSLYPLCGKGISPSPGDPADVRGGLVTREKRKLNYLRLKNSKTQEDSGGRTYF